MTTPSRHGWMLYGAYGMTGQMIVREALRRGHRPILAGRDAAPLAKLASETGLHAVALSLDDASSARDAIRGVAAVMNAAGPYFRTGSPLRELCLDAGTSYVDLNGEIDDFVEALRHDARARSRGIAIIPGAGFGVLFGEALAAHASRRLPGATWLRLSFAVATDATSLGAAASTAAALSAGGYAIRRGQLVRRPIASETWRVAGGSAARFASVPRAELVAANRVTGIGEIVTGIPLKLGAVIALRVAGPLIGKLMLARAASNRGEGATDDESGLRSRIWAEAGNSSGIRRVSVLETGEGYRAAAQAAVCVMERLLSSNVAGAMTPAQAFGPDLALSIAHTRIEDLAP